MSNYTTELRYIIETLAGGNDNKSIEEMITTAKGQIFDDYWTTYDVNYKATLEQKILRHYYTREIGMETYGLWKLKLNTTLADIMPKYNELYKMYDSIKDKLTKNVDLNETNTATDNATTTTTTNGTTTQSGTQNNESTSKNEGTTASNSTNTASGRGTSDAWTTANDTPQGALTGLEENRYLSSATHNKGATTQESNTTATSNATQSTTGSDTSKATTSNSSESTNASNSTAKTTSEYMKQITGNNGSINYIDEYMKLLNGYMNIDKMIIDELEPLFMGLY